MNPRSFLLKFLLFLFCPNAFAQSNADLSQYANPMIGTQGLIFFYGRTTPFVGIPFGMTKWTACTRSSELGHPLYQHLHTGMLTFKGTHKPAMWMGDYGQVSLKPIAGEITSKSINRKYSYTHHNEVSKPYYYKVDVDKGSKKMTVEMTATSRCGLLRFSYPPAQQASVIITASELPNFDGWVKIDTQHHEITGWNSDRESAHLGPPLPHFKGYFVIQFDKPFTTHGIYNGDQLSPGATEQQANACGAYVSFAAGTVQVTARVGTSFISLEQARDNLSREVNEQSFEQIMTGTQAEWNEYLSRIQVEGAKKRDLHILYSAMYHTLLFPRIFSEYGRYYSAFDDTIHAGVSYNDYSMWDTYRAEHPLLLLTAPEHAGPMVQSLVQMYHEGGWMPKWPNPTYTGIMIGTHADAIVADAVVKGVKDFDLDEAYAACRKDALVPPDGDSIKYWGDRVPWTSYEARCGLSYYLRLGYVPVDKTAESVSSTIEYSYDDFCVAQIAKRLGRTDDYNLLMQHSQNYRNLYNRFDRFFEPRNYDGTFHANTRAGFTEGSPWTYLFGAQHDVPGMIDLMGGRRAFVRRLNANFSGLHYIHENEPGHHYCYLYDYAGKPWKTQKKVWIYRNLKYRNHPDGMDGDDDCGQMSAWYIFSALGFYPVAPGTDQYAIGTPLFPRATIYYDPADRSRYCEVVAHRVSHRRKYVQSVTVNGKRLTEPFLHHADLVNGGRIVFEMGSRPNKKAFE